MKEQWSANRYEEVRAKTLDNNLTWLESFGCEIDRRGEIIYVHHDDLPEYDARLLIGLSKGTLPQLQLLLAELPLGGPLIYVDETFNTAVIRSALKRAGLTPVLISQVKAAPVTPWRGG
ncbi:MAG: hypothetical protein ABR501_00230, partial [Pyrinomonadaceae bacterium]